MPYPMKTARQDVQEKPAHELIGRQRHRLVASPPLGAVVLPAERHTITVHGQQSPVRDGHAVGIAGKVSQHGRRTGKRALGIHHPLQVRRAPATGRTHRHRPIPRARRRTATGRCDANSPILRGSVAGTAATARVPAGRSRAGRPPSADRLATGLRRNDARTCG